ncbi:AraC family transcriptional regulator [Candidatus Woesearchaeota archaeon]|nr:AraC family transcriptional regulator [Candidatus Woesearchaeota archaeon]
MEPKIVEKQGFDIVGMEVHTTMKNGKQAEDCPKVWIDFMKRINDVSNKTPGVCYGVCVMTNKVDFDYIACVESDDKPPEGMVKKAIPKSKYAVFTHKGHVSNIGKTWDYAYKEWLPRSNFKYNNEGLDFEYYDDRYTDDEKNENDIYIPIK